jgi:hypothetical protein
MPALPPPPHLTPPALLRLLAAARLDVLLRQKPSASNPLILAEIVPFGAFWCDAAEALILPSNALEPFVYEACVVPMAGLEPARGLLPSRF